MITGLEVFYHHPQVANTIARVRNNSGMMIFKDEKFVKVDWIECGRSVGRDSRVARSRLRIDDRAGVRSNVT